MSIPISRITAIASGRTWVGFVPAEKTSQSGPASWRNNPSAIWLRAEFPVQRINMRFKGLTPQLRSLSVSHANNRVAVAARASVTAGLAKEVDAVNQ